MTLALPLFFGAGVGSVYISLVDSVKMLQTKAEILAFVFEARIGGALTTTTFATALRLGGTLISTSSSAARFRAFLVTIEVRATGFFTTGSSGSDVSGVSGCTEFVLLRGDTELLVVVVVAGVLEFRPRFLVWAMARQLEPHRGNLEDKSVARRKLTRRVQRLLLISGAGTARFSKYHHVIHCLCATIAVAGGSATTKLKPQQHSDPSLLGRVAFAGNSLLFDNEF
jgi:hypothetical protein